MEPDFVHVRFGCLARWLLVYFRVGARALALVSGLLVLALAAVAVCVAVRRPRGFGLVSGHLFFEGKAGVIELGRTRRPGEFSAHRP